MAKKADFVGIKDAAEMMGVNPDNARVVMNWWGVESKDGEQSTHPTTGKPFGKPSKLYSTASIKAMMAAKAGE